MPGRRLVSGGRPISGGGTSPGEIPAPVGSIFRLGPIVRPGSVSRLESVSYLGLVSFLGSVSHRRKCPLPCALATVGGDSSTRLRAQDAETVPCGRPIQGVCLIPGERPTDPRPETLSGRWPIISGRLLPDLRPIPVISVSRLAPLAA